jgi:hypothetical protein
MTVLFLTVLCSTAFGLWLAEDICPQIEPQWAWIATAQRVLRGAYMTGGLWLVAVGVMAGVGGWS